VNRFLRFKHPPLTCQLSFSVDGDVPIDDVLTSSIEFDVKSGLYQCVVKPVATGSTASSSTLETQVLVKVSYANLLSRNLALPFEPAFHALTTQVHVSDLQPNTHLLITGKPAILQQLEFSASDASSLTIYSAQYLSSTSVKVPVRFNADYDAERSLSVAVRSPLTGQQLDVVVTVKLFGDQLKCAAPTASWLTLISSLLLLSQEWALSLLSLLGTLAAIYIGYRALFGSSYRSSADPVVFLNANSSTETGYTSPFIKRGPQLWSVDNDSPLHHSALFSHSSPNTSPQRFSRQSPF